MTYRFAFPVLALLVGGCSGRTLQPDEQPSSVSVSSYAPAW